jgi:flagellar motility protein MotE (MotC chaperone)
LYAIPKNCKPHKSDSTEANGLIIKKQHHLENKLQDLDNRSNPMKTLTAEKSKQKKFQ